MNILAFNDVFENLSGVKIVTSGDDLEKNFYPQIEKHFPHFENLWQLLVVLTTYRAYKLTDLHIDPCQRRTKEEIIWASCNPYPPDYDWAPFEETERQKPHYIETRPEVSKEIKCIGLTHYSVLLHIFYLYKHLEQKNQDYFEDILVHLSSISDLIDDLVYQMAKLFLTCSGKFQELPYLSENEFLEKAKIFYKKRYEKDYNDYLKKGIFRPARIQEETNIVKNFLSDFKEWNFLYDHFRKIKTYRNVFVHRSFVLNLLFEDDFWVPKLDLISNLHYFDEIIAKSGSKSEIIQNFERKPLFAEKLILETLYNIDQLWVYLSQTLREKLSSKDETLINKFGFNHA